VANSNLVKTAFFGQDPNWGRIVAALGSAGIPLDKEKVTLSMGGILVFSQDGPTNFNASKLKDIFQKDKIEVRISLGGGDKSYYVYTSDLSHDYIKINAEYST
jgi:glutamate N-acetyltransferase/amino-acid N-acetyltransferase